MPVRVVAGPVLGVPFPGRDRPIGVEAERPVDLVMVEESRVRPERIFVSAYRVS